MVSEPYKHCREHTSQLGTERDRREDQERHIGRFDTHSLHLCCILTPATLRSALQSLSWRRRINRRSPT